MFSSCMYFSRVEGLATFIANVIAKWNKQAIVVKQTILIWQKMYALPSHLTLLKCIQYEQCNRNVLNWIFLCSRMWCANIYHTFKKCALSSLLDVHTHWRDGKIMAKPLRITFSGGFQIKSICKSSISGPSLSVNTKKFNHKNLALMILQVWFISLKKLFWI